MNLGAAFNDDRSAGCAVAADQCSCRYGNTVCGIDKIPPCQDVGRVPGKNPVGSFMIRYSEISTAHAGSQHCLWSCCMSCSCKTGKTDRQYDKSFIHCLTPLLLLMRHELM